MSNVIEFRSDNIANFLMDIVAFDPFDPGMSARDRRDVCDVYQSPIAWVPLNCAGTAIMLGRMGASAFPRGRSATR